MSRDSTGPAPAAKLVSRRARLRHWISTVLGLDRAIGFTILARFWSGAAGIVTVALIAKFLSPAEQGYYYTFGSLVALQIVFELGFSLVILQMASHERAHLTISPAYEIGGSPKAHARLASVIQKSIRWYSVAAVLMAVTVLPAGIWFFSTHQHTSAAPSWIFPWCLAALMATANFQLDPILSFLEGCGYVAEIARLRFYQSIAGSLLAWGALALHQGLFAPAMMLLGMALASAVFLFGKRRLLLDLLRFDPGQDRIRWGEEVWSFQWRIAVSAFCGYFLFQLFNPVLFAYRGPVEAGQMGMSLGLANAIQVIAVSWISTKSAPFGSLIALRRFEHLDGIFFRSLKQSLMVCLAGALAAWAACVYLNVHQFKFAHRLLTPPVLGILFISMAINVVIFGLAVYLRAHKQEKLLLNSVLGAVLVATSTFLLGQRYGAAGMVAGYCALNFTGLIWATFVFRKYRKLWHET